MNYRRGFQRLALVVWVIYALGILTFPFFDARRDHKIAQDADGALESACFADLTSHPDATRAEDVNGNPVVDRCWVQFEANLKRDSARYSPLSEYHDLGWHLLWIFPVALVIPPLILYAIIRGLAALGSWIAGGFRETPGTQI